MGWQLDVRYCDRCRRRTVCKRSAPTWPLHVVLLCLTGGLWLWVMGFLAAFGYGPWTCTGCGGKLGAESHGCLVVALVVAALAAAILVLVLVEGTR